MEAQNMNPHEMQIDMTELPFTQDVKELFFNEGVFRALDYALRNHGVVAEPASPEYAQIHRVRCMVAGKLEKDMNLESPVECELCGRQDNCSEDFVPCLGRPALFFGNEKSIIAAFDALRSIEDRPYSTSLLPKLERVILQEFPCEFYGVNDNDTLEDKAVRLIRYAKELQKCVASHAQILHDQRPQTQDPSEYMCEICGEKGIWLCYDLLEVVDTDGSILYQEVCGTIKQLCRKHREERKPIRKDHITLSQLTLLLKSIDVEALKNNPQKLNWVKRLLQNCLHGLHHTTI